MEATLLDAARHHAATYADATGVARTPVPSLAVVRETSPSQLQYAINRPLVALVLQGRKRVTTGHQTFEFGAGDSLLITADVPTISQIVEASPAAPYFSLVLDLDQSLIAGLVEEMGSPPSADGQAVRVDPTEREVADAALRLMRLLDRPAQLAVLQAQLLRELHFWLLAGRHGSAIRSLGTTDSHAQRIGRATALIRAEFSKPLRVDALARVAGMGASAFHEYFRAITSLTPLQFQKQLRLIEARRLMLTAGTPISNAAYAVGYESVTQFTREYGRFFQHPPARDIRLARAQIVTAA